MLIPLIRNVAVRTLSAVSYAVSIVFAVEYTIEREETSEGEIVTESVKVTRKTYS